MATHDPKDVLLVKGGLYAKLAEVCAAIGRVEKRGRNDFHKYDYVTEADLVDAVRGELSQRQIVLIPSAESVEHQGNLTTVAMTFTFVDGETGETHTASWAGTGEDKGDKGLYKAYTGAIKYFLMKSFLIPTGDDPERDDGKATAKQNGKPELVTTQWVENARTRIAQHGEGMSEEAQKAFGNEVRMKLTALNAGNLSELTPADASRFDAWLSEQTKAAVNG